MKRILALIFLLSLLATAVAQEPSVLTTIIDDFRGMIGGAGTDLPFTQAADIVNFDFHLSGAERGGVAIRKRSGFETMGTGLEGATGGIYRYAKNGIEPQLLATFGRNLYVYSEAAGDWIMAAGNPLACSCKVTNGQDTVLGLKSKWFIPSTQGYDTIGIGSTRYLIRKLYSDSMMVISTNYAGATSSAVPCTLVGVGPGISTAPFEDPNALKPGIVYKDTLYIFTENERVSYAGGMAPALAGAMVIDSITDWRRSDMTAPVYIRNHTLSTGQWLQVCNPINPRFNIAMYIVQVTPTMVRVRCDTNVCLKLNRYNQRGTVFTPGTYTNICSTRVATVTKDSVIAYPGQTAVYTDYALCTLRVGSNLYRVPVRRTRTEGFDYYIYRYKVRSCTTGCTASAWPADSLNWMTTLADSWLGSGRHSDSGVYRAQIPVLRDSDATGPYLAISTIGVSGSAVAYAIDSTNWEIFYDHNPCPTTFLPSACLSLATRELVRYYAASKALPVLRTHGASDWMVLPSCYPQASLRAVLTCNAYASGPAPFCSAAVACYSTVQHLTGVKADGATKAFDVGDSIVIRKQLRAARPTLATAISITSSWSYPIVAYLMDRLWIAGNDTFPNLVQATKDYKPDTISTTQLNVFDDDGARITALWADQNIIYAGKSTGIYLIPIQTSGTDALEPAGCFPSRATVGPLSQSGVVKTPLDWAFASFDGVYLFDGSNTKLLSASITDFWRDSLDAASISQAALAYDYSKNRLLVSVTQKGYTVNNMTLVYDVAADAWTRYSIGARFWETMPYPSDLPRLYWGAPELTSGRICRRGNLPGDSGEPFIAKWRSGWMTFGQPLGQRTRLSEFAVELRRSRNANLLTSVYVDGSNTARVFNVPFTGSNDIEILGNNYLWADSLATTNGLARQGRFTGDTLGLWTTHRRNFPAGLSGERFSIEFNAMPTQSVPAAVSTWILSYGIEFLPSIPDDSCEVSGLRIDHVPAGKSPW